MPSHTSTHKRARKRSSSWPTLIVIAAILGALWGYINISLIHVVPFYFLVWGLVSAVVQFYIGRFLGQRIKVRHKFGGSVVIGSAVLMIISYTMAQHAIPILYKGTPMLTMRSLIFPPIIIELFIFISGMIGIMVTVRYRLLGKLRP